MVRPLEPNDSALLGGDRHEETIENLCSPFYEAGWRAGRASPAADLARWLQDTIESQPAITIRRGVEPQVAWRALADELLRRVAANP